MTKTRGSKTTEKRRARPRRDSEVFDSQSDDAPGQGEYYPGDNCENEEEESETEYEEEDAEEADEDEDEGEGGEEVPPRRHKTSNRIVQGVGANTMQQQKKRKRNPAVVSKY